MYDFPSYNDDLVSYDRDFDPIVFQSQDSVRTTDSLINELTALVEEDSTSHCAVKLNLLLSKLLPDDSVTATDSEQDLSSRFPNRDTSKNPIFMDLRGFAHLQNDQSESSCSESDDSSVSPEQRDPWIAYFDRPLQDDDSFNFEPLPGLECWELISRISRVSRVSRISRIRRTKDRPAGGQGTTMEVTVFSFAGTIASN